MKEQIAKIKENSIKEIEEYIDLSEKKYIF